MTQAQARIELLDNEGPIAPATLLGANLDMTLYTHQGLVSERLENPKFCYPFHEQTGLAHGWNPSIHNMGGMHCRLIRGVSLSGDESQMVHVYGGGQGNRAILQKGVVLRAGERLEAEMWARVRHAPVTLEISIHSISRKPRYDSGRIVVDSAHWKRYTVPLHTDSADDNAVFSIDFITDGQVYFDQVHLRPAESSHLNEHMDEFMGRMKVPTVRFAGGSLSGVYDWKKGTGPVHLRPSLPDPVFKWRIDYDYGIEEYLDQCLRQDIFPFLNVHIGASTPEAAGEMAAYCENWYRQRGLTPPTVYFMIGNEEYGFWEPGHMNAAMYVEALKQFVPVIRSHYSSPRIIALGTEQSDGAPNQAPTPLRELVLKEASGLFDMLTIHRYCTGWSDQPAEQIEFSIAGVESIRRDLSRLIADCRAAGSKAAAAMTEWNFWLQAAHWDDQRFFESDDARHGIFYAGVVHAMASLAPDMEMATYYNWVNVMGMVHTHGGRVQETGISDLYKLYRPAFPGKVLPVNLETPKLEAGHAQVDALAIRSEDACYVFLCNRSAEHSCAVRVTGSGRGAASELRLLHAESVLEPMTEREAVWADQVREVLELPPLSVARIRYDR